MLIPPRTDTAVADFSAVILQTDGSGTHPRWAVITRGNRNTEQERDNTGTKHSGAARGCGGSLFAARPAQSATDWC